MRYFLIIPLFIISSIIGVQVKPVVKYYFSSGNAVSIGEQVGEKLNASYNNRILAQDINKLIDPLTNQDEHNCWQSEFWGKWFTSAVQAFQYNPTPELMTKLTKAVNGLIATQSPEGYIGNYAPESRLNSWDIWGRKYVMLGLISYYDITNDKASLNAAIKQADFLIKELNDRKHSNSEIR